MTESQARDEICRVGRSLFERGYVHATAGNISVRLPESEGGVFLMTPTDACLGFLEPQRLARLDAQGVQISGDKASKTLTLHRRIYEATASEPGGGARCVIHTHSTHCVALSLRDSATSAASASAAPLTDAASWIPPITPYFVMKVGRVPLIAYSRPGDPQAAECVAQAIAAHAAAGHPIRAVMLERLGPNVWHASPAQAMATLEELEETARLLCLSPAGVTPLSEARIDELRQSFGARW